MQFSRFCAEVQELLKNELPSAADVDLSEAEGTICVTVRTPADVLYPSIPLVRFYDAFLQGVPVGEIIRRILTICAAETLHPFCTASDLGEKSEFLNSLGLRPASLRLNRHFLPLLPHAVFLDMLFFFTALLPGNGNGGESAVVTREIGSHFKLTDSALLKAAAAASKKRSPAVISPLPYFLDRLSRELGGAGRRFSIPSGCSPENPFYVLTNECACFGASVILYPGLPEELHQRFGPYYLIPSSVHEFLLLPQKEDVSRSELKRLIRSSNRGLCDSLLVLSDDLYYHDEEHGLQIC